MRTSGMKKSGKKTGPMRPEDYGPAHVLDSQSSFAAVEAYKAARTNLLFTRTGEGCQIVAVTSSFAGEGKTINCINLAITLAQNGLRVLLLDADMRRPMVRRTLGTHAERGLSELLAGLAGVGELHGGDCPLLQRTQHPNLSVLTAGHMPPNPAELLASGQMSVLLEQLTPEFDYIMIDTPPVCVVTDALVLSKLVNGYIFVVRSGQTPMDGLKDSVLRMEQVGANIIGFLLNDVDAKSSYQKYSYRYKKDGKYGSRYGYGSRCERAAAAEAGEPKREDAVAQT